MRAKSPIVKGEYSYGGLERRKVKVVQNEVNVIEVKAPVKQA